MAMYRLAYVTAMLEGRTRHDPVLGMTAIAPGTPKSAGKGTHRGCVAPGVLNADTGVIWITWWDVCLRPGHC